MKQHRRGQSARFLIHQTQDHAGQKTVDPLYRIPVIGAEQQGGKQRGRFPSAEQLSRLPVKDPPEQKLLGYRRRDPVKQDPRFQRHCRLRGRRFLKTRKKFRKPDQGQQQIQPQRPRCGGRQQDPQASAFSRAALLLPLSFPFPDQICRDPSPKLHENAFQPDFPAGNIRKPAGRSRKQLPAQSAGKFRKRLPAQHARKSGKQLRAQPAQQLSGLTGEQRGDQQTCCPADASPSCLFLSDPFLAHDSSSRILPSVSTSSAIRQAPASSSSPGCA